MRLLVDEALQEAVAHQLADAGHDATPIRLLGLAGHTDDEVMALSRLRAAFWSRPTPTSSAILALTGAAGPSVVLLRGLGDSAHERIAVISMCYRASKMCCWREQSW